MHVASRSADTPPRTTRPPRALIKQAGGDHLLLRCQPLACEDGREDQATHPRFADPPRQDGRVAALEPGRWCAWAQPRERVAPACSEE